MPTQPLTQIAPETAAETATDPAPPASNSAFYYLVVAENACGSSLGNGPPRNVLTGQHRPANLFNARGKEQFRSGHVTESAASFRYSDNRVIRSS